VNKRAAGLAWVVAAFGLAVALVYVTFVGSVLNSCGAGNHGPNPGAEEEFCGHGSGEPSDYSALFVFVQLIPAIPILLGGLLPSLGRSRLFFAAGVGIGVLSTALIWALEP
jgi:MFS-type transporter involved in bile tolerance (Atg22 family)